ncbi:hypothetical protein [Lyngbya sp. PCC 8106]|nr:hypothetical protein [Lyngbya sp. PCC 8106]
MFIYGIGNFLNSLLLFFGQGTLQLELSVPGVGFVAHRFVASRLHLLS